MESDAAASWYYAEALLIDNKKAGRVVFHTGPFFSL